MTFDLHIHTAISDGSLCPDTSADLLRQHADYVTVTDHSNASYHNKENTGCSFTGVELHSCIKHNGRLILIECLFYGFSVKDIPFFRKNLLLKELPSLAEHLSFMKERTGAKLFLAHPYYYGFYGNDLITFLDACAPYVDGFECLHFSVPLLEDVLVLLDYCRNTGKLASGGSDSHENLEKTPYLNLVPEYPELFAWIPEMAKKVTQ